MKNFIEGLKQRKLKLDEDLFLLKAKLEVARKWDFAGEEVKLKEVIWATEDHSRHLQHIIHKLEKEIKKGE